MPHRLSFRVHRSPKGPFSVFGSPFPQNWIPVSSKLGPPLVPFFKMGHSVVLAFLRKVFFFSRSPEDAAVILLKKLLEAAHIQVSRNCMNLINFATKYILQNFTIRNISPNVFQAMLKNIINSHCAFNIKTLGVCVS